MIGIQVVAWPDHLAAAPATVWFDAAGGDIGRGADCTLALPDPGRHLSRRHARVLERGGRFYLQPLSAGLPVTLDGAALTVGEEAPLAAGMRLALGGYELQVLEEPESLGGPSRTAHPEPALTVDLLVGGTDAPPVAPAAAQSPPAPPPRSVAAAPSPPPSPPSPPSPAPGQTALRPAAPAMPAAAAAAPELDPADAAAALAGGLGLAGVGSFDAERMRRVGALLRAMTQGTLELLTARMVAKRELGAAATQLRTRENNPLKFSPDVDTALAQLLGPTERGFLDPQSAVQEAFDDLRAHQVALLAGMRAALDAVMSRFDPAALESRLAPGGALDLIPANRRARLWTAYGEEYARIVGEIEEDFDALLGRAFLKAYQAQLQALAAERPSPTR